MTQKTKSDAVCTRIGLVIGLIWRTPFMLVGDLIKIVGVFMGLLKFEDYYWTITMIRHFFKWWKNPDTFDD